MTMHYTTELNASKKGNDANYRFEICYACAVIVTSPSAKTTLLAWHYFWWEEIGSDTFWTDLVSSFLCKLINNCFSKGVCPNCLKIAEVILIFNKGDRKEASNYRPISILSQFDKIAGKFIYSHISNWIEKK